MNRASFIRLGLVSASSSVLTVACNNQDTGIDPKAGGVYYTKESPGRWSEKVGSHAPQIEFQKDEGGVVTIKVINSHPMDDYEHYIVKHQILDSNFRYITEKIFDPNVDLEPTSEFKLKTYNGTLHALSFCNLHDVWLSAIEIS